jgi:FtsP/CotA-like multicopper oxidase with cupredoxin domain
VFRFVVLALLVACPTVLRSQSTGREPGQLARAGFEDYRAAAGRMEDGVLRVSLEAREASWRPWGDSGRVIRAHVFAEAGVAAKVPGPMIRVRAGTPVAVTLTNTLADTLVVRGLRDRRPRTEGPPVPFRTAFEGDSLVLAPGATAEVRFTPTSPGGYYYYGNTVAPGWDRTRQPLKRWGGPDDALTGPLVVDAPDETPDPRERVFLITQWADSLVPESYRETVRFQINGRSWPHTERLTYAQGDTVRWRVINQSGLFHPMHLHGFYFTVDQVNRPDGVQSVPAGRRRLRVTQPVPTAIGIRLTFVAHEPGNWLYHCHLMRHMSSAMQDSPHDGPDAGGHAPSRAAGIDLMAGLALGFTVTPAPGRAASSAARRTLRLHIGKRERVFGDQPAYAFVLQDGPVPPARDSVRFPSSPIFLTRGEPSEIVVRNNADVALGVHWHGLELESRSDGVAGWSGSPARTVPAIPPGDSLVVRITPPRAGTFMYHVHSEPGHQLSQGLYGQFIVVDPDRRDAEHDRFFLLGSLGAGADAPPAVNGSLVPEPLELRAGTTYRFRFMHITPDDNRSVTLRDGDSTLTWRVVALDGADSPPELVTPTPANLRFFDTGTTLDALFTPQKPGTLTLRIVTEYGRGAQPFIRPVPPPHTMNIPIRVTAATR